MTPSFVEKTGDFFNPSNVFSPARDMGLGVREAPAIDREDMPFNNLLRCHILKGVTSLGFIFFKFFIRVISYGLL